MGPMCLLSLFSQYLCVYAMTLKTESCQDIDAMKTFISMVYLESILDLAVIVIIAG